MRYGGLSAFFETFVLNQSLGFFSNFSAENPPHRKAAKRYASANRPLRKEIKLIYIPNMKKIKILLILVLITTNIVAQAQLKKDTPNTTAKSKQEYTTSVYRLFPTQNTYTFIKLDTRNGRMWQVQWYTESKSRFTTALSEISLVNKEEEKNGRFTLYPTTNMYNFILLDQIEGKTWQVQWNNEEKDRMVIPIY